MWSFLSGGVYRLVGGRSGRRHTIAYLASQLENLWMLPPLLQWAHWGGVGAACLQLTAKLYLLHIPSPHALPGHHKLCSRQFLVLLQPANAPLFPCPATPDMRSSKCSSKLWSALSFCTLLRLVFWMCCRVTNVLLSPVIISAGLSYIALNCRQAFYHSISLAIKPHAMPCHAMPCLCFFNLDLCLFHFIYLYLFCFCFILFLFLFLFLLWFALFCFILFCFVLFCFIFLFCFILFCFALFALFCLIWFYLYCFALFCFVLSLIWFALFSFCMFFVSFALFLLCFTLCSCSAKCSVNMI